MKREPLFFALVFQRVREGFAAVRRGRADVAGALLRAVLLASLGGAFAFLFSRFTALYLDIAGEERERAFELLAFSYAVLLLLLVLGAASSLIREIFREEETRLFSAMPVPPRTLLGAKLAVVWGKQVLLSVLLTLIVCLPVCVRLGPGRTLPPTLAACLILPLLSVSLAALVALPYRAVAAFFRGRALLSLIAVTALFGAGAAGYSFLLRAVKELLLGEDLRYFFSEEVLSGIGAAAKRLFPADLLARLTVGENVFQSVVLLLALSAVSVLIAFGTVRALLAIALRPVKPSSRPRRRKKAPPHGVLVSLLQKEFWHVFRTPSYAFSYFSVALVMPVMVYFCASVGTSLLRRLLGADCTKELVLFLTLLYGALTNAFCATNVSREGKMFLIGKSFPVRASEVFAAKTLFCLFVGALSQGMSALLLAASGQLSPLSAAALFGIGVLFSFAQICFATKYDLSHARLGEGGEGGAAVIVLGLLFAFVAGGGTFALRLFSMLRFSRFSAFPVAAALCALAALGAGLYLFLGLEKKYRAFGGDA